MKDIHGGNIWEAAACAGVSTDEILDFSASINPHSSSKVASALRSSIRRVPAYPDPSYRLLRSALAAYHEIDPAEVAPGNGSTEFIYLMPQVWKPSSAVIVEPAFSEYRRSLAKTACKIAELRLREEDGFAIDLAAFDELIRRRPGVCWVANPSNPAGTLTPAPVIREMAAMCKKKGALLVVDEAFMDFCEHGSVKREAARAGNMIVLRSMTKFWGIAGLRLGCAIGTAKTISRLGLAMPPWSVNTPACLAGTAALADAGFINKTLRWCARERDRLFKGLSSIPGLAPFPSSANYVMVKIAGHAATAPSLGAALRKDGILIRDLGAMRGLGKRYFRVAVRRRRENERLLAALRKAM